MPTSHLKDIPSSINSEEGALKTIQQKWTAISSQSTLPRNHFKYTHLMPIIQLGPTCGLVAVSMITRLCQRVQLSELLTLAKNLGYTKQGEMFSAVNMLHLIERTSIINNYNPMLYEDGLCAHKDIVIEKLMNDAILLVPYDVDKDHSPGLFNGHRAHWTVICGIISCGPSYFLIGRHGKSLHPGLWLLEKLDASNLNIKEIDPQKRSEDYVTDDVSTSLRGKFIVLTPHR